MSARSESSPRPAELRICGLAAVRARFKSNLESIQRLYFDEATSRKIGMICRALAASHRIYRCVPAAELEKIAGSIHHGGIVAVVEAPPVRVAGAAEAAGWARRGESVVVLDRIGNAHNLGAIARTAAYFGVPRIVIAGDATAARPGDAAYRVSEGGLESLDVWTTPDTGPFLRALAAAGFDVVGAATRGGSAAVARPAASAPTAAAPTATAPGAAAPGPSLRAPWALVLGNEEQGLAPDAVDACTRTVTIPGSGRVESLNVSAAAAVLIHQLVSDSRGSRGTGPGRVVSHRRPPAR